MELSCWTEEGLANKKLFPKFQFTVKHKSWVVRSKTS